MTSRLWLVVDAAFVIVGLVGAVFSWRAGVTTTQFAATQLTATQDGSPAYSATHYSGSWIGFAALLLLIGLLAAVDGGQRLVRH